MIPLSENSKKVLQQRYLLKNVQANGIESAEALFKRVSKAVAAAELKWGNASDAIEWENKFYDVLSNMLFLPNSPTLMNAGTAAGQLSACFVLPVEDSMNSIFNCLKYAAIIQQHGGGTGFNFSRLNPKTDILDETGTTATGPVSVMNIFNAVTEHIKLGGKRRGANMGILNIDHPDIEDFILAKREDGVLNNFNLSVAITDKFMSTLSHDGKWNLVHPVSKVVIRKVAAKKLWQQIIESAWQTGDPGLIFTDTINTTNPTPKLGKITSTNPCGEVPLLPYESCNLGSINLSKFVQVINGKPEVDWIYLEDIVKTAVRFLDNVIEVNHYITPGIKKITMGNRKIGLGVMGWAELLILLEIPYASEKAVQLGGKIMQFIQQLAKETSIELAYKRSVFPNWNNSIYFNNKPIRNATRTSIAPTGSISLIAGCSASIEPLFALALQQEQVLNAQTLIAVNPHLINYLKKHGFNSKSIINSILKTGTAGQIKELPEQLKNIFKTALEIPALWHLKHQMAFQQYTDNAVSKTINLPKTSTIKTIDKIYKTAWLQKAKGITVFRNNSKEKQVLYQGIKNGIKTCKVCVE